VEREKDRSEKITGIFRGRGASEKRGDVLDQNTPGRHYSDQGFPRDPLGAPETDSPPQLGADKKENIKYKKKKEEGRDNITKKNKKKITTHKRKQQTTWGGGTNTHKQSSGTNKNKQNSLKSQEKIKGGGQQN